MSKEWFDSIPKVKIKNETYQIFKVEKITGGKTRLHFIWGKTDFRWEGDMKDGKPARDAMYILRKSVWYRYEKISGHGIFLEETKWTDGKENVFIETPAKLAVTADELFSQVIENNIVPGEGTLKAS